MDFRLYARVLWRFRLIVAAGLVCALLLAALSIVRIGPHGVSYRQSELWSTTMRLLVTQRGAPEVRLYAQEPTPQGQTPASPGDQAAKLGIPIADPARFNTLAILYSEFATSDPVRRLMLRGGPIRGQIAATALRDDASGVLLPLIDLVAISTSPREAVTLASRGASALDTYVARQQRTNNVPTSDRVVVRTIVEPKIPQLYQPRSKTMAIVVFLVVMLATVGLAFLLENMRPRVRVVHDAPEQEFERAARRRTA
jgi:hypothetical protein